MLTREDVLKLLVERPGMTAADLVQIGPKDDHKRLARMLSDMGRDKLVAHAGKGPPPEGKDRPILRWVITNKGRERIGLEPLGDDAVVRNSMGDMTRLGLGPWSTCVWNITQPSATARPLFLSAVSGLSDDNERLAS